jgi:hypothetical protein
MASFRARFRKAQRDIDLRPEIYFRVQARISLVG